MNWSYTAGAFYRLKGVFGSLVFGGYDASRFTPNNVTFTMASDNLRDPVVTICSITSTTGIGETSLVTTPQLAFIDSSIPELWLPKSVCEDFAQAFDLTFDVPTGLYLVNATTHTSLLALNHNIKITLANQKTGGSTTDIVIPYSAFDLNISPPMLANRTSYYFPIRQGKDETQHTLGRTFLQEVHVTAHYESRRFNVSSHCVFNDPLKAQIIALSSVLYTTSSPSPNAIAPGSNLSNGTIAGIIIGVLALLTFIRIAIVLIYRRHTRAASRAHENFSEMDTYEQHPKADPETANIASEAEMDGHDAKFEKFGNPIMVPQELEGLPVPIRTRLVDMSEREGGLGAEEEYIVSPKSARGTSTGTMRSGFGSSNGRRTTGMAMRPLVVVSSPTASPGSSPASPGRGSKIEEHKGK